MLIQSGGIMLSCTMELPAPDAPLAVILHGITGNRQERHIVGAADALRQAGFGTLRVDLYGHGESGGSFSEHTIPKWVRNALDVLDYASTVSSSVFLCGHSQGGLTAMLAGKVSPSQLSGLILLSPAWNIPDGARKGELLGMRFDPELVPDHMELPNKGVSVGREYIQTAQSIRIGAPAFSGPVLIVHGEADQTVPVSWSKELARRYRNALLVAVPGDTHCYDHHLDTVQEAVKTWALDAACANETYKSNQLQGARNMRNYAEETEKRIAFIRKALEAAHADGILFGNSGGKDSALVGILCKMACDNTEGIILPCSSRRNFTIDKDDGMEVAEKFGIKTRILDLTPQKELAMEALGGIATLTDAAISNIAPRLRMITLYAVAASENRLVAGTGNASEYHMGYFTKWGDGAFDLNPIADLTATEVFEYLRYLNAPEAVITKAPSAGLFEGQTDEDDMGVTYAAIDRYITTGEANEHDKAIIDRYHARSGHKRRPALRYPDEP